ncbi:MAG: DUF4440 domain-containing protein [Deltaproteobacteria bacterium]|nr:DUF4440 domain-containing protein [Deltaproteobacteria bacterium]
MFFERRFLLRGAVALGLFSLVGCAHAKIARTDIDDTQENREIIKVVGAYHTALEHLDADELLALVSPAYYEDNGNMDAADDYDFDELAANLREDFAHTKAMKVDLRVDAVEVDDDEAFAELFYTYHAHNEYPSGMKWESGSDRTRLRLRRTDGQWLITAGL